MIDDELGAANIPPPIPFTAVSSAKAQHGKSTGSIMRPMKLAPNTTMPAVAKPRAGMNTAAVVFDKASHL